MAWLAAELPPDIPPACVQRAASHYAIPEIALVAVLRQENGQVGKEYPRRSGLYFGPWQISDKWVPHFARWGITAQTLRDDACMNAGAGAYVLAYYLIREGSWRRALARFNVGSLNTPEREEAGYRYADAVLRHWKVLYEKWGT